MFEPGLKKLHFGIISFTIGFWSLFLMLFAFVFLLVFGKLDYGKEILEHPLVIVPLITWVSGILIAVCIYVTIRCKSCGRLLLVVTDIAHKNKNKNWVLWFLRSLPPVIVCEHCGVEVNNAPNQ
jgi:hypothetical protein